MITEESLVTRLVTFNEKVSTPAGTISPVKDGFVLSPNNPDRKERIYSTALPAVRALLHLKPPT